MYQRISKLKYRLARIWQAGIFCCTVMVLLHRVFTVLSRFFCIMLFLYCHSPFILCFFILLLRSFLHVFFPAFTVMIAFPFLRADFHGNLFSSICGLFDGYDLFLWRGNGDLSGRWIPCADRGGWISCFRSYVCSVFSVARSPLVRMTSIVDCAKEPFLWLCCFYNVLEC